MDYVYLTQSPKAINQALRCFVVVVVLHTIYMLLVAVVAVVVASLLAWSACVHIVTIPLYCDTRRDDVEGGELNNGLRIRWHHIHTYFRER